MNISCRWLAAVLMIARCEGTIPQLNTTNGLIEKFVGVQSVDCSANEDIFCKTACEKTCKNNVENIRDLHKDCIDKLPHHCNAGFSYWDITQFPGVTFGTTQKINNVAYNYWILPFSPLLRQYDTRGKTVFGYSHDIWPEVDLAYQGVKDFRAPPCDHDSSISKFTSSFDPVEWSLDDSLSNGITEFRLNYQYTIKNGTKLLTNKDYNTLVDGRLTPFRIHEAERRFLQMQSLSRVFRNDITLRVFGFNTFQGKTFDKLVILEPISLKDRSCMRFRAGHNEMIHDDKTARALFIATPRDSFFVSKSDKFQNPYGEFLPKRDTVCSQIEGFGLCSTTATCDWCMTPFGHACSADCSHEIARKTTFENKEGPLTIGFVNMFSSLVISTIFWFYSVT